MELWFSILEGSPWFCGCVSQLLSLFLKYDILLLKRNWDPSTRQCSTVNVRCGSRGPKIVHLGIFLWYSPKYLLSVLCFFFLNKCILKVKSFSLLHLGFNCFSYRFDFLFDRNAGNFGSCSM